MTTIYIAPEIFEWELHADDYRRLDSKDFLRPYDMFRHAEELAKHCEDEFTKTDLIATLKRCVMKRAQQINSLYTFKRVPIPDKPRHLLDQMSYFGMIKPMMLNNLVEIRNAIEHKDSKPPSKARCMEFLEFVWYFLRSTDTFVKFCPICLYYKCYRSDSYLPEYSLVFDIDPSSAWFPVNIRGWLPSEFVALHPAERWISLECCKVYTFADFLERLPDSEREQVKSDRQFSLNDMGFDSGKLQKGNDFLLLIAGSYFELVKNLF